jgi:hypothetical protein
MMMIVIEIDPHLRFERLINCLATLDYPTAVKEADAEARSYARRPHRRRPKSASVREADRDYDRLVGGLLFWLYHGIKPDGLKNLEFQMIRPLCEAFVDKGQYKSEVLALFGARAKA